MILCQIFDSMVEMQDFADMFLILFSGRRYSLEGG